MQLRIRTTFAATAALLVLLAPNCGRETTSNGPPQSDAGNDGTMDARESQDARDEAPGDGFGGSEVDADANPNWDAGPDVGSDADCVLACGIDRYCCKGICEGADASPPGFCVQRGDTCKTGWSCCSGKCVNCDGGFGTCQ